MRCDVAGDESVDDDNRGGISCRTYKSQGGRIQFSPRLDYIDCRCWIQMLDQMGGDEDKLGIRTRSPWLLGCGSLRGGLRGLAGRIPFQEGIGDFRLVSNRSFRGDLNLLVLVMEELFLSLTMCSFIVLIAF